VFCCKTGSRWVVGYFVGMGCNVSYIYSKIYIVGRGGLVIENSLLDQMVLG